MNTHNRLRYFLTNTIFFFLITGYVQVRTYDFHCKICNSNTFFHCLYSALMNCMIFNVLSSLEAAPDTVQYSYCIFFIALSSLED